MKYQDKLTLFIVDDDHFSRMFYQQHLLNLGYTNCVVMESGYDCIRQLDKKPDVIFLDYDMKPFNGMDVLKVVRKYNPGIHMLMISGNGDARLEADAEENGAYEFIRKGDDDLEAISNVLSRINEMKISELNRSAGIFC